MSDYGKLIEILIEADKLIQHRVTSSATAFIRWKDKIELFTNHLYGKDSLEYGKLVDISYHQMDFSLINEWGSSVDQVAECAKGIEIAKGILESFIDDVIEKEIPSSKTIDETAKYDYKKVFIVHGRNGELKEAVARLVERQGIEAIILSEQVNQGRTIIEKFEENSDVGGAICLFTADDVGNEKSQEQMNPRARQNVVFEAGFFMGKLGRSHVILLADKGVEMPSDLSGVVYSDAKYWQLDVLKELDEMGYQVDLNKLK